MDEAEHIAIQQKEEERQRTSMMMSTRHPIGKAPVASRSEGERERERGGWWWQTKGALNLTPRRWWRTDVASRSISNVNVWTSRKRLICFISEGSMDQPTDQQSGLQSRMHATKNQKRPIAISCLLWAISDWWIDRQTNRPTDGKTNGAAHRVACTRLKILKHSEARVSL